MSNMQEPQLRQQKCLRRRRQQQLAVPSSTATAIRMLHAVVIIQFVAYCTTVEGYVPNHHSSHPLHPILTSSTITTATAEMPSSLSKSKQSLMTTNRIDNTDPTFVSTIPNTKNALATPTVDQLELYQLLQRRQNSTATTAAAAAVAAASLPMKKRKATIQRKRSNDGTSSSPSVLKDPKSKATTSSSSSNKNYVPLLTAAQEMEYAYQIRTLRAALRIREQLVSYQNGIYIHPTEEQWCAACGCTSKKQLRRIIHEGQDAKTQLISANTGLVAQYAKKQYSNLKYAMEAGGGVGTILTVSDMIQEGHFGLIEAAERYQPEKGFRFSTYATYWVKQRILRCISDTSRTIRLPAHVHEMLYKIKKAKRTIYSQTGHEPTISELAQYLEISEDRIRSYTASSRNVISLERPISGINNNGGGNTKSNISTGTSTSNGVTSSSGSSGKSTGSSSGSSTSDDTRTLLDSIPSDGPTPEEDAVLDSMRRDIRAVLDTELVGLEQQVLRYRFGLLYDDDDNDDDVEHDIETIRSKQVNTSGESYSVKETSQILKISMDKVRLLEARALNKLRHPMRNYKLKDYVQGLTTGGSGGSSSTTLSSRRPSQRRSTTTNDNNNNNNNNSNSNSPTTNTARAERISSSSSSSSLQTTPSSPIQQWMSFQSIEDMTKSRLEEAFANSPSSYHYDASNRRSSSAATTTTADRFWFF